MKHLIFLTIIIFLSTATNAGYILEEDKTYNSTIIRFVEEVLRPLISNRIDFYLESMGVFKNINSLIFEDTILTQNIIKHGSGKPVFCGQRIKVILYGYTEDPHLSFDDSREVKELLLGSYFISKGLDLGIIGMKKGEIRQIKIPKQFGLNSSYYEQLRPYKQDIVYEVELVEIVDNDDIDPEKLTRYHKPFTIEKAALCGDTITASIEIKSPTNNILYKSTEPIEFRIGKYTMPIAVELGAINILKNGTTTIISPPEFLHNNNQLKNFNKINEISLINITVHNIK